MTESPLFPSPPSAPSTARPRPRVAIIGAGPAGLMAAERLSMADTDADIIVFDAMASAGRKFLMAGKGGMNITHSEAIDPFLGRYAERRAELTPFIEQFPPHALREWVHSLGISTFIGSSGRVFPADMKAAPMLRAWLHRLRHAGVTLRMRHKWIVDAPIASDMASTPAAASTQGDVRHRYTLRFDTPDGIVTDHFDVLIMAMGGASWPRLGSDAAWVDGLRCNGIPVIDFRASNGGFETAWTPFFATRFAGQPLKNIALQVEGTGTPPRLGECMLTEHGIEGGLIYALSASIRDTIAADGSATLRLDLLPGHSMARVDAAVSRPRGKRSLGSHLQGTLGLSGAKAALLYECLSKEALADPAHLAAGIKSLPLRLARPRPIAEAISSAGGVSFDALNEHLMIRALPGVFCAGEMIDWEAPTGGYLLTACLATGVAAGDGARRYLLDNRRA